VGKYRIKEDKISGECCASGSEDELMRSFSGEHLKEKNNLEDLGIDGRVILSRF
jgi:hypothetical protein